MRTKNEIKKFIQANKPVWQRTGQMYRQSRENLGLSCTHSAERLGISRSTLAKFENGEPMFGYNRLACSYGNLLQLEELKQNVMQALLYLLPEDTIEKLLQ